MFFVLWIYILIGWTISSNFTEADLSWRQTKSGDYELLTPETELPIIVTKGEAFVVQAGENVTLPCEVDKLAQYNIVWKRKDTILWIFRGHPAGYYIQRVMKDPRMQRSNTSLFIQNVSVDDEGKYFCEVLDSNEIIQHELVVLVPPSVEPTNNIAVVQKQEGTSVILSCKVSGKPKPKVTWHKEDSTEIIEVNEEKLVFHRLSDSDGGLYTCKAQNHLGQKAEASISLEVQYAPRVKTPTKTVYSGVNKQTILLCSVDAIPPAKVRWLKKGAPVNPMRLRKGIGRNKSYTLHFPKVLLNDFGSYSCNASNYWGNSSATILLTGKPATPTITSPTKGNFTEEYLLRWETLSYAPIIAYAVLFKNDTDSEENWANITIPGLTTQSMFHSQKYTMRDLIPGATINIRIKANNELGESPWSDVFTVTTFDPDSITSEYWSRGNKSETNQIEFLGASELEDLQTENVPQAEIGESIGYQAATMGYNSSGYPMLTAAERRAQMTAFITAISLSAFFY